MHIRQHKRALLSRSAVCPNPTPRIPHCLWSVLLANHCKRRKGFQVFLYKFRTKLQEVWQHPVRSPLLRWHLSNRTSFWQIQCEDYCLTPVYASWPWKRRLSGWVVMSSSHFWHGEPGQPLQKIPEPCNFKSVKSQVVVNTIYRRFSLLASPVPRRTFSSNSLSSWSNSARLWGVLIRWRNGTINSYDLYK